MITPERMLAIKNEDDGELKMANGIFARGAVFHLPPSILHPLWLQLRRAVYWWLRCSTHLWRELILPSRRIWAGLAAVWLLLLIINLSQRDPVSGVTGQPVHAPAVTMSWQLQQRWMDELLADRSPSPEADRPRTAPSRPRTEEHEIMAA